MDLASCILQRPKPGVKRPEAAPIRHSTFGFLHLPAPLSPQPPSHPVSAPRPGPTRPGTLKSNLLAVGPTRPGTLKSNFLAVFPSSDPTQLRNLANVPEYAAILESLREKSARYRNQYTREP